MPTLSYSSRGPYVELLQSTLKKYGYYTGEVDGIFGWRTYDAVIAFQLDNGLNPDGIVGARTWAALRPLINGYTTHTVRSGDTFFRLARQYATSVSLIAAANPDADPDNLQIGQSLVIPFQGGFVPTDISYTYPIMRMNLYSIAARFPFVRVSDIGESVLGNKLSLVTIGSGGKQVSYNASHHANEWITSVVLMKFIEDLSIAYATNQQIYGYPASEILSQATLYIVPMVNPDGVNLVTGEYAPGDEPYSSALAMNTPGTPFPSGWKANINGVDLNVNYPAEWELSKQIKYALGFDKPGPREFVGPYPLSEPESSAMANFTEAHDFRLILAYHTQGEVIYWMFMDRRPPRDLEIGEQLSAASGYPLAETPYTSGFAGYKDWFIQDFNMPGYTIEAGKGVNPLPISQFQEIYEDNIGILVLAAILA